MSQVDPKFLVPTRLDDPPQFLWWDFDVAILAMGCLVIGIAADMTITFIFISIAVAVAYQQLKGGKHRAYGLHLMYWYMPLGFGFKVTPESAVREFIG
jgi:conjugal transfer pilus assembly protein TraL